MKKLLIAVFATFTFCGCVSDQVLKNTTSTRAKSANANMNLPTQTGPKPTLAVTGFKNEAGWRSRHDLGQNMETMLESAMVDTRSFRMVDRTALGSVLAEQNLKKSGASTGAGAQSGQIASARYIVEGAITEASEDVQGTGGGIKVPIGNTRVGLGGEYTRAQLTAIIKVIDTTTSEIVGKETVRGQSGRTKVDLGLGHRKVSGNLGSFAKTPMAEAAQDVINQAAAFVTQSVHNHYAATGGGYAPPARQAQPSYTYPPAAAPAARAPVQYSPNDRPQVLPPAISPGKVAMIDGNDIIINRGAEHGVQAGQDFQILGGGAPIVDPDTGAVIGQSRGGAVARVQVISVEGKMSRARLVEGSVPQVGQIAQ